MENSLVVLTDFDPLVNLVLNGLDSENSRRSYSHALSTFLEWWNHRGRPQFCKSEVLAYKEKLIRKGNSPSTVNIQLAAIKKLAREAEDNGLIDATIAQGISHVHGVKMHGTRTGNWLNKSQARQLIDSPDISTREGLRDRALLSILIGAGLRRSEAANLRVEDIQQLEDRWIIVDLVGKGNRRRSIPIPQFCKDNIDAWIEAANIKSGPIFRAFKRYKTKLFDNSMTPQAVHNIVEYYSRLCGFGVAAHDLRRSFARLSRKGGAQLEQIQLSLGHASIKTTERYLNVEQDLVNAPCDYLDLGI